MMQKDEPTGEGIGIVLNPDSLQCPKCYRLIVIPDGSGEGTLLTCHFCSTNFRITKRAVYIGEIIEK